MYLLNQSALKIRVLKGCVLNGSVLQRCVPSMSMVAWRSSRYTEPMKLRGMDSWNNKPFTNTKSPRVSKRGE